MLPETSIVIAAYNEEQRLPASLGKIQAYLAEKQHEAEVLVVDDGSTDATASLVREMAQRMPGLRLISYPKNRGKGYALRQGVQASRGKLVLVSDADLSTPIEELETLKKLLAARSHHIAIGSRALPQSEVVLAQPPWRRGMGRLFNKAVRLLVTDEFSDTQCGFKLFHGEVARKLFGQARIDRFAYDVEILALARRYGYRVAEVPIQWRNCAASKVNPALDSLQMLGDLVKIRLSVGRQQDGLIPLEKLRSGSLTP
ncbi:glycosyl transferase [Geoanaerobacter pelophilus]|uniref:dolichyl-phosphate beta-glucosyltransferase n=1 Tax=Geoanaerobacter pelophilus TaxID=60036 RepID=A0ABQ0MDR0_9BACT|nr:dolichyl-phosphate beta-glucosyltransferase [Geoanaerobacter pelophilus]GAW65254.1 glycosyl transferase [Geoanaerobacter pelophilus]